MPSPDPPRFIITADDFGRDAAINAGTMAGLLGGFVTHASLMVNTPGFEEACALATGAGVTGRIGLHLNLADGAPLTDAVRRLPRFVSPDGAFTDPHLRDRWTPLGGDERRAVADEIRAQVALARRQGCPCGHLDSHRYVHTMPNMTAVVVAVAREVGIRRVRPANNCGSASTPALTLGRAVLNAYLALRGVKQVEYFGSIDELMTLAATGTPIRSVEIMTHPIAPDMAAQAPAVAAETSDMLAKAKAEPRDMAAQATAEAAVMDGSSGSLRARLLALEPLLGVRLVASGEAVGYDT